MTRRSNRTLVTVRAHWLLLWRRAVITDTEFGSAGLGRPKLHPRSEVGRVISVLFAPHLVHHVFVLDRQDRLLLRLDGHKYTPKAIDKFVKVLGVPVTDHPDVVTRLWSGEPVYGDLEEKEGFVTVTEFDRSYPGLLSEKDFRRVGESPVLLVFFRIASVAVVVGLAFVVLKLIFDFT